MDLSIEVPYSRCGCALLSYLLWPLNGSLPVWDVVRPRCIFGSSMMLPRFCLVDPEVIVLGAHCGEEHPLVDARFAYNALCSPTFPSSDSFRLPTSLRFQRSFLVTNPE